MAILKPIANAGNLEGDKRQHFPYILEWSCKKCGITNTLDFQTERYLSYPVLGKPYSFALYCDECDTEDEVKLLPQISLMVIET